MEADGSGRRARPGARSRCTTRQPDAVVGGSTPPKARAAAACELRARANGVRRASRSPRVPGNPVNACSRRSPKADRRSGGSPSGRASSATRTTLRHRAAPRRCSPRGLQPIPPPRPAQIALRLERPPGSSRSATVKRAARTVVADTARARNLTTRQIRCRGGRSGLRVLPEERAFADEVEAFLDDQRRPGRLRRDPGEHGPDRRHPDAPRVHDASSASRAGSGSPGRRSTAARRARASTSTCSTRRSPARGGPQIGKGVGIIGKTLIRHGSDELKAGVPAQDPAQRGRVRRRLQRARRRLRRRVDEAEGDVARRRRLDAQRPEDLDHLGALRRVVLGRRPHRPRAPSTTGITLFLVPLDHPGITIKAIWTMGDERTNEVFFDDVFVPRRLRRRRGQQGVPVHLRGARPRALHDVHVLADQAAPRPARATTCATATRDGEPLQDDPVVAPADRPAGHARPRWPGCSACGSSPRR